MTQHQMREHEARTHETVSHRPKVVVIGAGFGGLFVAKRLADQPVDVLIIDRNNYHTFTPLIYQVATCGLGIEDVVYSVRRIFSDKPNINFLLGEVADIDRTAKQVMVDTREERLAVPYDYLVIAAGTVTNYFGNDALAEQAFGLKTLEDAVALKAHIVKLFEQAEWAHSQAERDALTNIVVVGGGATGLEMAGSLYELSNQVLRREYKRLDGVRMRVIVVELLDTLLQPYPERLRKAARAQLEDIGVEVILGTSVERMEAGRVYLANGTVIPSHTLVWTAGVQASPLAKAVGVELGKGGSLPVKPTLEVKEAQDIYAVGDIAYLEGPDGKPYPQLIPVAQQQAALAAQNILRRVRGEPELLFTYHDKGSMATIGRRRAVAWPYKRVQLTGWIAWLSWLGLHLIELIGFRNRIAVLVNWMWNYLAYDPAARMVLEDGKRRPPRTGANAETPKTGSSRQDAEQDAPDDAAAPVQPKPAQAPAHEVTQWMEPPR